MLERTVVAIFGDFGRTPKINATQGEITGTGATRSS